MAPSHTNKPGQAMCLYSQNHSKVCLIHVTILIAAQRCLMPYIQQLESQDGHSCSWAFTWASLKRSSLLWFLRSEAVPVSGASNMETGRSLLSFFSTSASSGGNRGG